MAETERAAAGPPYAGGTELLGPTSYRVSDAEVGSVLLSRVLGGSSNDAHLDENTYLSYNSGLRVSAVVGCVRENSYKHLQYNLRPRTARRNLPVAGAGVLRIDGAVRLSPIYQKDISDAARKNAALPFAFQRADLLGVAERLASGMAHFANWGAITVNELRGGNAANVRGIMAATENIAIDPSSVFITKKESTHLYPAAFCALAAAVNGEGGTVYSDLVTIDGNGVVQIRTFTNAALARGCYEALMMIGQMYSDADAGPAFALAVTRGCHKLRTVVAHSDEGGYVRNVLRTGYYTVPFGAVLMGSSESAYTGMPTPSGSIESFRRLVDAILLGSGAAVSIADPMVEVNGKFYPTTLTLYMNGAEDPGTASADAFSEPERVAMQRMWAIASREWAKNFTYLLGVLFCATGKTDRAVEVITACSNECIGMVDNHLDHRVVVPFFFIEPTSVWPKWIPAMRTMQEECGPLAVEGTIRSLPPFSGLGAVNSFSAQAYTADIDFRYARRHPIIVFCEQHADDGTAHMKLFSGTPNKFANVGGNGDMATRILAANGLDNYLWGRLHSQIVGIGELVNFDERLRLMIEHETFGLGGAAWNHQENNVPDTSDLDHLVQYSTSRPTFAALGGLVADNRAWTRSRSAAAQALWAAKNRPATMAGLGVHVRPTLGEPLPYVSSVGVDEAALRLGGAEFGYTGYDDTIETEPGGEGDGRGPGVDVNGSVVPIVIHNMADRGRRAARPGGQNRAGGIGPHVNPDGPQAPPAPPEV